MNDSQRDIASFLIRFTQDFWRSETGDPQIAWRGHIRHVQGEGEETFTDFADALKFIQDHLAQLTLEAMPDADQQEQEKALKEGFKLWERFASSYSNMIFEAMERTMAQSESMKSQMDKAVEKTLEAWRLPRTSRQRQVDATIADINSQIEQLANKVAALEKTFADKKEADEE
jgi:hypothetical protein